jgi:hypothetical protein
MIVIVTLLWGRYPPDQQLYRTCARLVHIDHCQQYLPVVSEIKQSSFYTVIWPHAPTKKPTLSDCRRGGLWSRGVRKFVLILGAPVHAIHVIHHAVMSGLTVHDLCVQATRKGAMPSELLSEAWLRLAASACED